MGWRRRIKENRKRQIPGGQQTGCETVASLKRLERGTRGGDGIDGQEDKSTTKVIFEKSVQHN